jgi:tetratricopeptide (TPR) repeat protein
MHKAVGDYDASMRDQLAALDIDPMMADAHTNMGALYHDLNRIDEAIVCHRRAIAISPQHPQANWNLSLDLILSGQMQEGWKLYEWRLHRLGKGMSHLHHGRPRLAPQQALTGLTVLLTHEQGFGDTLQFCRFALVLKAAGANILFEAPVTLHAVLRSLYKNVQVFEEEACNVPFDVWCPLLSLPLALQTQMDSIPNWSSYLSVDTEKSDQWEAKLQHAAHDSGRSRLSDRVHAHTSDVGERLPVADWLTELAQASRNSGRRMRIGLCVSGNPQHENTHNRDMPLGDLLAALPDCHDYVILQKRISDDSGGRWIPLP